MDKRPYLLFAALSLALFSMTLAFCFYVLMGSPASAPSSSPALASTQLELPEDAADPLTPYLIKAVGDEICILQGEDVICHTGVSVSLLPKQDREALSRGIIVESREDLTALLEDITS